MTTNIPREERMEVLVVRRSGNIVHSKYMYILYVLYQIKINKSENYSMSICVIKGGQWNVVHTQKVTPINYEHICLSVCLLFLVPFFSFRSLLHTVHGTYIHVHFVDDWEGVINLHAMREIILSTRCVKNFPLASRGLHTFFWQWILQSLNPLKTALPYDCRNV